MRLRQGVLVAADLGPVADDLRVVLGLGTPYVDPGVGDFGLTNAVFALGDTFLEVVAPVQPDTAAGRHLERRGGDGGYMVIIQSDDLDADRARVGELGVRTVWQADLDDIRGTHLHPADVGGAILSLDAADPPASWRWGGPDWEQQAVPGELVAVELQAADPAALAERWSLVLDRPAVEGCIALDRGALRFVEATDGRGDGVSGFEVAVPDPDAARTVAADRGLMVHPDGVIALGGIRLAVTPTP